MVPHDAGRSPVADSATTCPGARRKPRTSRPSRPVFAAERLEPRAMLATLTGDPGLQFFVGDSTAAAVAQEPRTFTITWRWNENLTITDFNSACDVLALDWFSGSEIRLTQDSGTAVLSIPSMQQSYRLVNLPLSSLTMANFTCKDPSATAVIAGVLANAGAVTPATNPSPSPAPTLPPGGLNSGDAGDLRWGETYFAPYVDMGAWPVPNLGDLAVTRGVSLLTLGFIQASPEGLPAWAGLSALGIKSANDQAIAINQSIRSFQASGGDVMVSLGGAAGTSLAQWYATHGRSAADLAYAYAGIVDAYALNRIDFDIEGAAVADSAAIALGSDALKLLQNMRPGLEVWYTLPVLPTGLTTEGLGVVRSALRAGVVLDGVNVMAMDYGEWAAPTSGGNAKSMGAYAVLAAESAHAQLVGLFAEHGVGFGWNQLGVTPMIGVNDVVSEVFTVADAQVLEDFARGKGVGMLSMWSVARDNPGTLGQATASASGLPDPPGSFSRVFADYGRQNDISSTPTPSPVPSPLPKPWARAGDANLDGVVDILDVMQIVAAAKYNTVQPANWQEGDFNGDGVFDLLDLTDFAAQGLYNSGRYADQAAEVATIETTDKVLTAYFPEWGIYGRDFQVADVPADTINHLVYAFLDLNSSGEVAIYDSFAAVEKRFTAAESVSGEADLWYYPPDDPRSVQTVWGNFNQLAQLKEKHPHLRVSIAVGGWTLSRNFSRVCSTAAGRETFASSLVRFLDTYRMFDGIDFDWEYPGGGGLEGNSANPNDGVAYADLLRVVRSRLDSLGARLGRRYGISVASPAGIDKIAAFNAAGLAPSVDHFNVMTYDFHGTWETTTGHQAAFMADPAGYDVKTAVQAYLAAGVDPKQIVVGAPLYTRGWSGVAGGGDGGYREPSSGKAPGTFEAGVYDYKDLLGQLQDPAGGWQLYWDDTAQAAYVYNASKGLFSSFETPTSIAQKSEWADDLGLGGMMFWDTTSDALDSPESLIAAAFASWVKGDDLDTIRGRSSLSHEVIVGGDGIISTLPPLV